jgi:hypothetical protein
MSRANLSAKMGKTATIRRSCSEPVDTRLILCRQTRELLEGRRIKKSALEFQKIKAPTEAFKHERIQLTKPSTEVQLCGPIAWYIHICKTILQACW